MVAYYNDAIWYLYSVSLSVHKPEKELTLLRSEAAPYGTSEWIIRHVIEGDEVVIFRCQNFPIFFLRNRMSMTSEFSWTEDISD